MKYNDAQYRKLENKFFLTQYEKIKEKPSKRAGQTGWFAEMKQKFFDHMIRRGHIVTDSK